MEQSSDIIVSHEFCPVDISLEEALVECGWQDEGPDMWFHPTRSGRAGLRSLTQGDDWRLFELQGGEIPTATPARYLHANSRLPGPAKYVTDRRGRVICRADLPAARLWNATQPFGRDRRVSTPHLLQWIRTLTQLATGTIARRGSEVDLAGICRHLVESGRSASLDDDRVLIHVSCPGAYAQIVLADDAGLGYCLSAELRVMERGGGRANRAAVQLAGEANRRLPLARFTLHGQHPPVLGCAFCFGSELIPSVWLPIALETVESALALTLRELQALRDPALARLLTAVATA